MIAFHRGAKIKPPEESLTLLQAAYVVCVLAEKDGITSPEDFLRYMTRAWKAFKLSGTEGEAK